MGKRVREPAQWESVQVFQQITGRIFLLDDWLCPRFQAKLRDFTKNHRPNVKPVPSSEKENHPPSPNKIATRLMQPDHLLSLLDPPPRKCIRRAGPPEYSQSSDAVTSPSEDPLPSTSSSRITDQSSEQMDYDMDGESNVQIVDSEQFSSSTGTPIQPEAVYSEMSESDSQMLFSQATNSSSGCRKKNAKVVLDDGLYSVPFSESSCVICGRTSKDSRKTVPGTAKKDLWLINNIYLPKGVRSCQRHISEEIFCDAAKDTLEKKKRIGVRINKAEIAEWIRWLTDNKVTNTSVIDFDSEKTADEAYVELLGLTKDHFGELFEYVREGLHSSANRSPRNALAIFLAKMRLGVSQRVLARLFGIKDQATISHTFHRVTQLLAKNFVPKHLGFLHLSRDEIMRRHLPSFVRKMFELEDGKLVFILDGTYFFIQSSGDFVLQGKTYSSHKHRHLVKFMMIVTPDGYVSNLLNQTWHCF